MYYLSSKTNKFIFSRSISSKDTLIEGEGREGEGREGEGGRNEEGGEWELEGKGLYYY